MEYKTIKINNSFFVYGKEKKSFWSRLWANAIDATWDEADDMLLIELVNSKIVGQDLARG